MFKLSQLPDARFPFLPPLSRLWALALRTGRPAAPASVSVMLPAAQAARLHLRRGETLLVRHGRLWLTREGDLVDHVLTPGAGHVAAVPQEVVVEAFGQQACLYERHRMRGA